MTLKTPLTDEQLAQRIKDSGIAWLPISSIDEAVGFTRWALNHFDDESAEAASAQPLVGERIIAEPVQTTDGEISAAITNCPYCLRTLHIVRPWPIVPATSPPESAGGAFADFMDGEGKFLGQKWHAVAEKAFLAGAKWASAQPLVGERIPGFIRREVERAIEDAENPKGMSVHDGKARIGSDKLRYLLKIIDALASKQPAAASERENIVYQQCAKHQGQWFGFTATVQAPSRYVCPNCEAAAPSVGET